MLEHWLGTGLLRLYLLSLAIYRLYLSPIANIPGSKLAAATGWYETYFDVVKGGQFTFQIEKWHKQFGPIIRINPTEIHIADPEFFDVLYSQRTPFDKIERFKYRFGTPTSAQATVEHRLHHVRRAALSHYFSKQQVLALSSHVQDCTDKLCRILNTKYRGTGKPVKLNDAWAAWGTDIVTYFSFGWSWNIMDFPDFVSPFTNALNDNLELIHVAGHFGWLMRLSDYLPDWMLGASMQPLLVFQQTVRQQILKIKQGENTDQAFKHRNIFASLVKSELPPEELSVDRLQDEGLNIVAAGIETIRSTLIRAVYYVLSNPYIAQKLREELRAAFPDPSTTPSLSELEKLPYLTAVLQESLRLFYGMCQRMPRTSPTPLQYGRYTIPPGYIISMGSYQQHNDERIFPSPRSFIPQRWMGNPTVTLPGGKVRPLTHYLTTFSKGTRICLGKDLAWAELYIGLAKLMRKVDMELFETGPEEVEMVREYAVALPKKGSKGVRVLME